MEWKCGLGIQVLDRAKSDHRLSDSDHGSSTPVRAEIW